MIKFRIRRVKDSFRHDFGPGANHNTVEVPAGTRVVIGVDGRLWADHSIFPRESLDWHDAYHRGIPVAEDNIITEEF